VSVQEQLKKDTVRMDYLESEPMDKAGVLFRRNVRITRQTIDEAIVATGAQNDAVRPICTRVGCGFIGKVALCPECPDIAAIK